MLLFFIRHADPIYNPDSLTPIGKRQAESLARRLARYGLDELYVSSSNRAIETINPTAELLKKEPVILDWTNEKYIYEEQSMINDQGKRVWGYSLVQTRERLCAPSVTEMGEKWVEHPFFKGTSFAEGYLRIKKETLDFLEKQGFVWDEARGMYKNAFYSKHEVDYRYDPSVKTCYSNSEKRIAVFAHHGFGTNFLSAMLGIPFPQVCLKMNFGHTGMTVIQFDESNEYIAPQMLTMSNDGHLLADNMPTAYNNSIYY